MRRLDASIKFLQKRWIGILVSICLAFLVVTALALVGRSYLNKKFVKTKIAKTGKIKRSKMEIESKPITEAQIDKIKERNIFNAENIKGFQVVKKEKNNEIVESKLKIQYNGGVAGGHPKNGIAIIENLKTKTINSYFVDDVVMRSPTVTLHEIYPDRIIVKNSGALEYIKIFRKPIYRNRRTKRNRRIASLPTKKGVGHFFSEDGLEVNDSDIKVSRLYWENMLKRDLPRVLQDAKASPNMVDGQLKGFKLDKIRANSIYLKVGLKNGDVIKEINGIELNDTGKALGLLQRLKSADAAIAIKYSRGGVDQDLSLDVGR